MCDTPVIFEPTFTLNGIPILPDRMSGRHYAAEDRRTVAVTHLAMLGVKKQEAAFWGYERKEQPSMAALFFD